MGWGEVAQIQELLAERYKLRKALKRIAVETQDELAHTIARDALGKEDK